MKRAVKQLLRVKGCVRPPRTQRKAENLDTMPFADDFRSSRLPVGRLGVELVRGAFLGFRRHAVNRFIKSLVLYGNDTLERSRLGHHDAGYRRNVDVILQNYLQRMPLDQLLVLYQLNLKCTMTNTEAKYSFIEAISRNISRYMQEVTSCDTVEDFIQYKRQGLRTRNKRYKEEMCAFLFQTKDDLLKCRKDVLQCVDNSAGHAEGFVSFQTIGLLSDKHSSGLINKNSYANGIQSQGSCDMDVLYVGANGHDSSATADSRHELLVIEPVRQGASGTGPIVNTTEIVPNDEVLNQEVIYRAQTNPIALQTKSEDCFLSTNVMSVVFGHIFNIKFWHKGFPFNTWINQYFAHNAALYHPTFAMLYVANVVALLERSANQEELDVICTTIKNDLMAHDINGFIEEQRIVVRLAGYTYETRFGLPEMIEMFSTVKRLAHHMRFKEIYPWVVKLLCGVVKTKAVDPKLINSIANVCNRNDGIGGVETLLEILEMKMLGNIDYVTCMDVCSLLQAMYKHDMHSQELVDAMAYKLNADDRDELSISAIALSIQTLGRMQANLKNNAFLHKLADMFVNSPHKFIDTSESNCSGILWGFYKLHFKHAKFLDVALQRYSAKDLGTPNVNSLVISLTALTRLDACNNPSVLIEIYKMVLKNISNITISTAQQLITCVTRMQENITLCCSNKTSYKHLVMLSGKVINAVMKHVCERLMDQISTVQAGAMLNALYRSRHRTHDIIAPLIVAITGSYKKGQDWHSAVHVPKRSIYAYESLPQCPFDVDVCAKKLEKIEVTHLVGICEAIHGLDYWSPYSLHLMLQIKKQIKPQLHDMKATHILASCISFVNWPFTDFQMDTSTEGYGRSENPTKEVMLRSVREVVDHDISKSKERAKSWFDEDTSQFEEPTSMMDRFRVIINRSYWKEDFLLGGIESLHRHANFLYAASMPLRKLKMLYDMLRFNVYLHDVYSPKIKIPLVNNNFMSSPCSFLILEHSNPRNPSHIANIMPQNLIEFQTELYAISRTESFYNFLFGDGNSPNSSVSGLEDEEEMQIENSENIDLLRSGKEVPTLRPLHVMLPANEDERDFSSSCYHKHQGSGAIFEIDHKYIYVDPVIGGFRTTLLLLDSRRHYIPHLVENIYNNAN
ncbi:hypothetical protein X943_000142 [Babesia divergens]|uniref:Uncharacterized protein n=1 Tax=Babesia divergens TaxID=32595 RepID=A0AAD9LDF8_BABDI|nr:hypothetical protein X943_000142 [Babesia divergens]